MNPAVGILRGAAALHDLQQQTVDLRGLDLPGFRCWLDHHLAHWHRDPIFLQRLRIRELRCQHPHLRILEKAWRAAGAADAASASFARLQALEYELRGVSSAVSGLTAALQQADPADRSRLLEKLEAFHSRQHLLEQQLVECTQLSPERQRLQQVSGELRQLHSTIGLDAEEEQLARLLRQQGQRSSRAGKSFEQEALRLTEELLLPEVDPNRGGKQGQDLLVLQGVCLGAAQIELDQVVIQQSPAGQPVEVLAVVEVKRNVNDLAHGFRQRQGNLAWLTGDRSHYVPNDYRSRHFPAGHFDRPAPHRHQGETFLFTRDSFHRFTRDPVTGWILDHLYLIARSGPLWGISSAGLLRLRHRIATDERWNPKSESYLDRLLAWSHSLTHSLESPDVLNLYAGTAEHAAQLLVVRRGTSLPPQEDIVSRF